MQIDSEPRDGFPTMTTAMLEAGIILACPDIRVGAGRKDLFFSLVSASRLKKSEDRLPPFRAGAGRASTRTRQLKYRGTAPQGEPSFSGLIRFYINNSPCGRERRKKKIAKLQNRKIAKLQIGNGKLEIGKDGTKTRNGGCGCKWVRCKAAGGGVGAFALVRVCLALRLLSAHSTTHLQGTQSTHAKSRQLSCPSARIPRRFRRPRPRCIRLATRREHDRRQEDGAVICFKGSRHPCDCAVAPARNERKKGKAGADIAEARCAISVGCGQRQSSRWRGLYVPTPTG